MRERCETGCMCYTGGEVRHHKDCFYYPESMTKMFDETTKKMEAYRWAFRFTSLHQKQQILKALDEFFGDDDASKLILKDLSAE